MTRNDHSLNVGGFRIDARSRSLRVCEPRGTNWIDSPKSIYMTWLRGSALVLLMIPGNFS